MVAEKKRILSCGVWRSGASAYFHGTSVEGEASKEVDVGSAEEEW